MYLEEFKRNVPQHKWLRTSANAFRRNDRIFAGPSLQYFFTEYPNNEDEVLIHMEGKDKYLYI